MQKVIIKTTYIDEDGVLMFEDVMGLIHLGLYENKIES